MKIGTKLLLGFLLLAGVNYAMSEKPTATGNNNTDNDFDDDEDIPDETTIGPIKENPTVPIKEIPAPIDPAVPVLPVVKSTVTVPPPVSDVELPLNGNLLLKKGMRGNEVRELERLMGVMIDGFFSANTEDTLFNIKGLRETTLNQYLATPNVTVALVKGNVVKAAWPTVVYKNLKPASGVYMNSEEPLGQVAPGNIVGTIQHIPDSMYYVVITTGNSGLGWVLQSDVVIF